MLQSHKNFGNPALYLPAIPSYRFNRLESPLDTAAKSAGFENWGALLRSLDEGHFIEVLAPETFGSSDYLLGGLFQAAFSDHAIEVVDTRISEIGDVYLVLKK